MADSARPASAGGALPSFDPIKARDSAAGMMCPLVEKLGQLRVNSPHGASAGAETDAESESLVRRHWSCEVQQDESPRQHGRYVFHPLKVMSFNSLARSLVDGKYVNNDRDVMSWSHRKFAILDVVRQAMADVVCLQEVDQEEYDNFFRCEFERLGYASVYKKKKSPKLDGVCTLYKAARFELLVHSDVELPASDANFDRLQVAVVVALVDRRSRREGDTADAVRDIHIVANTHLLFNKNRGDIKFQQLCELLSAIKDVENKCRAHLGDAADKHPKPTVIMCGDFNFTPQSLLYHFLSKGYAVMRNCNAKLISGQYLMFDTTYKTELPSHARAGITVGSLEGNYLSDIYGTGAGDDWVGPLTKTPLLEEFSDMPDWMKGDGSLRPRISNYLGAVLERSSPSGGESGEEGSPPHDSARCDPSLGVNAGDLLFCHYKFTSAYSTFDPDHKRRNEPAFTAFHGWQRGCVDYIWYTRDELDVESIYELPSFREVEANGNLPNKGWPSSDHFSLISQFKRRDF